LLILAAALLIEWGKRGHALPSSYALLTKIVDLCSDREACKIFGMVFGQMGASKKSVVKRLIERTKTITLYAKDFPTEKVALPLLRPPKNWSGETTLAGYWPPSEAWEDVHRLRPDLQLLP
jgi:hypothetical protein